VAQGLDQLANLSDEDRVLVTLVQASFPLVPRPFEALADSLGTDEHSVLDRMAKLKEAGVVRKIGPVLEPASFGVSSELIAVQVSPQELDRVGEAVSAWAPVTHCYARSHRVNLWLAALSADREWFEEARERLLGMAGATAVWRLPALRRFKVAVRFDLTEGLPPGAPGVDTGDAPGAAGREGPPASPPTGPLNEVDIRRLAAVEADLPLCQEPFAEIGSQHSLEAEEILSALRDWRSQGRIRRYGALVSHLRLGFVANAMTVWQVASDKVPEMGAKIAVFPQVSHCYERPSFAEFPFSLYAMVHERSRERCMAMVEELSRVCSDSPRAVLFSTHEYKKSSPRYAELLAQRADSREE
jgi:DNA-binding Lrp family transcriptional regulator